MTLPAAIASLLTDSVTVRVRTGEDGYGEPVYGTAVTVAARVTYKRLIVSTAKGNEYVTTTVVYMDDIPGFVEDSEITLPDGAVRRVDQFSRPAWPGGARHLEVLL